MLAMSSYYTAISSYVISTRALKCNLDWGKSLAEPLCDSILQKQVKASSCISNVSHVLNGRSSWLACNRTLAPSQLNNQHQSKFWAVAIPSWHLLLRSTITPQPSKFGCCQNVQDIKRVVIVPALEHMSKLLIDRQSVKNLSSY